jgi:hypothetical protein
MSRSSLRYTLLTYRYDQLWLPAGFWTLFAIVMLFLRTPNDLQDIARAYLGVAMPLVGGFLAAYAILDDPALELRFSTPSRAERLLLERLGLIFFVQVLGALTFQLFSLALGADLSVLGNGWAVQLAWLIPTLALMALGCLGALLGRQTLMGAVLVGIVWLVELLARGWFANNAGKYFLVFMGALMPTHPDLLANQGCLAALAVLFFWASWLLLQRQERYL